MKKIIILVTSVVITLGMGITAFASDETTLKDQAGITPDSILYPIDTAIDNLKVSLSTSDESKASTLSNIAEERLGESEIMVDEDKTDLADKAVDDYKDAIDEAENKIEDLINKSDNQDDLKKLEDVESKVISTQKISIDVLTKLQNKLPDKAKTKITKVIEMQTAKTTAILEVKKERTAYNKAKKEYNEAKVALEQAKKTGDAVAIAAAENLLQQKEQALNTGKQNLTKAVELKKEAFNTKVGKQNKKEKVKSNKASKNNEATQTNTEEDTNSITNTTPDTTVTKNSMNNNLPSSSQSSKSTETKKNTKTEVTKPSVNTETKKESANNNENKQSFKAKVNNENQKIEH